jgi:ADP-L-glycero-D-manno-heptose 6-epimerase
MYLVTGADGFIASHLCEKLSSFVAYDEPFETDKLEKQLELPKAVFHLGAISSTTECDTQELARLNILSSCELLEWCVKHSIPFVYASSASVYGLGSNGFGEDTPLTPMNYYAISKASFDMFASQKMKDHPNAKIFGLRYFNVYGANESHKGDMASPIYKFTNQAKETGEIRVFEGSDNYVRDFISVDDVVDITFAAKDFEKSGIYNVGTGNPRSFLDVANIISDHTGAKIVEIPFPPHLVGKYQAFTKSDNTKLLNMCDHTFLTLEEGIARYVSGLVKG